MAVIVVNPIYIHQDLFFFFKDLLTTSCFSLMELTCQCVKQAIPMGRVRFLSVK